MQESEKKKNFAVLYLAVLLLAAQSSLPGKTAPVREENQEEKAGVNPARNLDVAASARELINQKRYKEAFGLVDGHIKQYIIRKTKIKCCPAIGAKTYLVIPWSFAC